MEPLDLMDQLEGQIEDRITPLEAQFQDPIAQISSMLELGTENSHIQRHVMAEPFIDLSRTPVQRTEWSPRYPERSELLLAEEPSGRYDHLPPLSIHKFHGNHSGARSSEKREWCFYKEEYISSREEDCEQGCSHWDSERMECVYFEDWEREHSPQED
jgi:hypothetical protein